MSSTAALPQSRPSSVSSRQQQQRWDSSEDHHKTGVTVTLPTIQVTEAKQQQAAPGAGGLEVLPTELIDSSGLPQPSADDTQSPNTALLSPPGEISTSFLPALSGPSKTPASGAGLKLPPLVETPVIPPRTLDDAIELVNRCNMMLYLTLKHPPSELEYNPYSFNVVSGRPKGLREYAILSNAGVTQVWPTEVTFTPIDAFQREFQLYNKLRKIRFFRVFRLRKTWQVWRKIVRSRKLREAKARITAYLVILQPPFFGTLANVSALCHKLSHMGLLEVALEEPVLMDAWVSDVQGALESVRNRLHAFRSLLLQVVASMVHTDEPTGDGDGSELLSGEKKSPRSNTGSSSMPRRHSSASIVKMVRVVDLMVASALRTILHNTVKSLLDTIVTRSTVKEKEQADEEAEEEIGAMFLVKVSVEENVIVCAPTQEALMGGLRSVVRMCEMTVLSIQPLLPYFTPQDRLSAVASDENTVLRTMLEDDSLLKESIGKVLSLVEDKWQKVEGEVNPLDDLLKEAQTPPREEGIQDQGEEDKKDMSELGSWLGRVEGLVETVRSIREVVNLGLLQVDQTDARRVLVTSLRQQQQRMHQDVSQGFDQRVKKLQAEATDKWLGLEMAPVTAQQVVTLLNYVTEVKSEMERVNGEESVIHQAYSMIQGYHITLHPEVHNKYEALQKELKRLRKCVRRSLMERPTMIRKLNQLLQKEIEELDAETVKLSEQVQALRFLRVTSDREEALKMLEAADSRASTIRAQATTVVQYQTTFSLKVCMFKDLAVVEEEIALKMLLWRSLAEWEELTSEWYKREVRCLDVTEVTQVTLKYREKADYLMGATQQSDVLQHLNTLVSQMQEKLPVLEALTDSALRPRHWQEIDTALGRALPPNLTLAHVDEMSLHTHAHTLQQVAHTAQLQREMENRLKKLEEDWDVAIIPVQAYIRKDLYVLGDLTDLESLLLASDLTLHLLLHSQHALHIKNETVKWKNIHTIIKETVAALRDFEGEWLALDLVLSSCTAMEVFPLQAAVFCAASSFWSATLSRLKDEPRVLSQLRAGMLLEELLQQRGQLEDLRACVSPLLGMRKQTCPRLFVLPDQDVVELLTKGQDLEVCHKYLRRMFTGVGRLVRCEDGQIVALVSPQQETLHLAKPVIAHHGVEDWLGRVESGMRATIRRLILKHVEDDLDLPTSELPLQVLDVCKRIQWSREVNRAFAMVSETQDKPDLQRVLKRIINVLGALTNAVRQNQSENRTVSPLKQARMSYLTATLLELRDTTQTLVQDNPGSSLSYSWLQHLRHVITGEGRSAGVQVTVGVGQLDYGYEYMGVSPATIPTPTTLKAHHGLITAAIQNRCGVAVGGVGGGKTETVKGVARAAGQHLAMLTCSDHTPAQSLQHVVCAGVQGGYWLLLEDADLLPPTLLSRLSQYAHNIYQAKVNALKRGVIDGQEMNLVDSFTLFMSVTSQDDATVTSSYPLLNHPITPHLTSVSVCPPTLNALLEAMLFGQGFSLSREYLQKARSCFVQLTNLLDMAPLTSLARLVQATARVACDIRHTSLMKKEVTEDGNEDASKSETADDKENENERDTDPTSSSAVSLWMRYPPYSETMSDEEIVTQALYAVTSPLQSEKEALWRQEFNKIFELEDAEDQERNHEPCDVEVAIKEVLLEWGYGDADDTFLGGESELAYEVPDESDIIKATQEGQQMIAEDTADKKEKEKEVQKEEGGKEMEGNLAEKEKELSSHGASIMKAALHMYSLLTIHHCCCIMAPSGSGKSVVWKVLAEALNMKKQKKGNDGSFRGVAWRVLQCGAFTRDHLLGNWDEERRMWRKGVLFHTLTELQQSPGECWLVLVGPFSQDILKSVSHLCHTSPTFKDEALNQVILEGDIRVIIEQSDEKNLISHARVRCPVLKLPTEAMTASGAAGRAMKRLLKVLPHLQGQREISEARTLVAEGLVNLELPQTSLMRVAGCVSRMAEARVTPATPPGELLEVLQQVLELLHTARHPHLHQDAREGAYTPARLGSRSPAPSDAFLDYANRVVATPELQAALTLLPQLLDITCPILLYAKPGHGLTTFLDIFERHRAPATRVIRFRCTPLSTAHELFSCMIGDLLPSTPPTDQSATSSGSDGENPIHDCLDPSMSQRDAFENIPILAPGDEGFSLLILEDVHLQLDSGGTLGTIWEIFRHMVEYGEVVCPSSGTRYRLQRVVPLLALSCHALPDQNVPARILRHCVVMGVPCISSRSCEHVVKVSLQDVLAELDEENFQPDATRDVVVELYQGLGQSSRPQTGSRPRTASRTRASSRPQTASRSRPSSRPQTASRSRASSRPRTASRPQTASRPATAEPPDEATEGPLSGPASDKGSAKDSFDLPDLDTSTSNGSRLDTGRKSRSASPRNTLPNLHHLLQLTEALRKNARLLQMTIGQSASLIAFEAGRIFSSVVESEEELSDRVFKIVKNKFEEVEEGLAWWPGQTEEGKKMMIHAKDYNEFVKNIQYPDGLQQIMFTQAHFMALLKLVITMETFWSHAVVVGPPGVGKLSLVKLAAHYTRARVYHLDDYRDEASRVGAVRSAVEASGVGGRRTVVVVRDHSVTPQLLDVLHSLAHTGWSETLLGRLRLRGLLEAIRLKGKELPRENKWMTYLEEDEVSSLRHRLITNVKRHLHVCLVSHSRHTTDSWCERYPPLRSRWSWVRLDRWDSDTLRQVARRILLPYDIPPHILHQMQAALPSIHLMLAREKGVTVTVSDYVEACRVTVTLLARRRTELRESLALFKGGMDKLQETGVNVEELKGELNELEPELKATQDEGNRLTQALAQHRNQVAQLRDQMVAQEERVKEKNDSVAAMNDEITQEVGEAMPALEATEKAVKALDKKDLVEVRVLNKPPDLVLAVMEPICILLNVKPDWASMKTLLGDPNMTKKLMEVEKDTISDATLRKLKKYTENPKFIPDEVAKVSKPCRPLCAWLKALDHYSQVLRNVEPKKLKLVELERELNGLQLDQRQLQQQLGQSERELAELQARYEACVCRRQQLDGGIKRATARLQRCTRLTTVLADEDSRWSAKIKTLMGEAEGVYGECTLGGVAVAYLGALTSAHRDQLLQNVVNILVTSGVVTPAKYDLMETLSTAEQRDTWEAADLYRDPACFLQAALVLSAIRRPLVLDPDYMCVRWLTRLHEEQGGLQVLHAGDEDLLSKVLTAAHARRPILVLHTPTHLTYNLRKLLEVPSHLQTSDGTLQEVVMILVTGSATPTLPPELCVHVTRVSFALPPLVLEERLLNDVLKMEREDLYEQRASLTASIMRDQKALEAVDDTILKKLTQASTALLDNEELLAAFYEAKSTSAEFRTRLSECRRTLQKIGNVRDKYRPVATRGRLLFSTSTALRRLSRNYVFSFQHFLHLFSVCITSGGRTETLSFDQRIHSLVVSVTQLVVTHVSRALHPAHRLAFTTALCAAISADAGTLTPPAWRAVLDPSVLDERALVEAVMDLEADFGGVGEDLLKGVRLQLSLHDLVTEVGLTGSRGPAEMPRGRISDFNALMLLRIAKPRQLVAGAREVVNIMLGDPHLLRPDLALGKLLGPEERKLPVLVWADYGRDVAGEVIGAAHARSVAGITRVIMATPAEKAGELDSVGVPHLASLLVNSVQQGGWIIVQGAESPSVLSTLLGAMTSLGSPDVKVHEDFRLVVTVSVTKAAPPDLTLLARPLYSQPAPTIPATLAAAATLINMHNYRHHYSGARWRRAVWQVAAAHTIASVTRHWHGHPPPPSVPPTHTPRTQIASGPSRPSSASPLPPTPTPTPELLDEPEARPSPGHVGLDGYVNLEELTETLKCLYKLSLDYALDDDTVVHFLAVVYGQQRAWQEIVYSIPGEVGVVSKEAAQSIVTAHLTACLQDLHNLTLDVEYRAFQDDLTTIASDIFEAPTSALDE